MELKDLKPVVNTDSWTMFIKYIDMHYNQVIKELTTTSEPMHIYRTQGQLKTLNMLRNLRDTVNAERTS